MNLTNKNVEKICLSYKKNIIIDKINIESQFLYFPQFIPLTIFLFKHMSLDDEEYLYLVLGMTGKFSSIKLIDVLERNEKGWENLEMEVVKLRSST